VWEGNIFQFRHFPPAAFSQFPWLAGSTLAVKLSSLSPRPPTWGKNLVNKCQQVFFQDNFVKVMGLFIFCSEGHTIGTDYKRYSWIGLVC
jgi:hypothetical protein